MDHIHRSDVEHIAESKVRLLATQFDAKCSALIAIEIWLHVAR